ncbi:MAG: efflux RND transporter permease subunit, partial [Cyanobacteria bacterium REEB67]|nr:efflux RND transporter permease subunit [Cyanobacteria bacterium REEB67]
ASLAPDMPLGKALDLVHELQAFKDLPASIRDIPAGDAEIQRDIFACFGLSLQIGILLIYIVLVLLFDGYLQPLTIMVSLPLALGGAGLALVFTHHTLGFFALVGIVMLTGLVTKNSILLVDYCLVVMRQGQSLHTALINAGKARMRPILMTTAAMVAGMLPVAWGIGAGSEVRAPMGICVIGGLISSTLFTLLIVPVAFSYFYNLQTWLLGFFSSHRSGTNSHSLAQTSKYEIDQTKLPQLDEARACPDAEVPILH